MQIRQIIRWFLYFVIFLLSWYFVTLMRTAEFGVSIGSIGGQLYAALISILPLSLVALLFLELVGYDWRLKDIVPKILIVAVSVIVLSEIWASSEEYLFKKKCTENTSIVAQDIGQSRWWPFTNNHLGYSIEGGFYAGE